MEENKELEEAVITLLLTGYQEINNRQAEELKRLHVAVGVLSTLFLACTVAVFYLLMR